LIKINLLPKTLRKRVEPGWWRLIAVAFPVITLGVVGFLQFGISSTVAGLTENRDQLQAEVTALDRYVRDQKALQAQQNELNGIIAIDNALRKDTVRWSSQITSFVERIPRSLTGRPIVALNNLSLRRVDAAAQQQFATNGTYDGKAVTGELSFTAEAVSMADVVRFVQTFERSKDFGIQFNQAQLQPQRGTYQFNATIGLANATAPVAGGTGTGNAQ
jgi:type IV pilus assembly protein PilN